MPQMTGSANAQSPEASEHACPVPGYTLERGECTAEPIPGEPECIPSTVGGVKTEELPGGELCGATLDLASGIDPQPFFEECEQIGGTLEPVITGIRCTFPITPGEPTCPGDVPTTEEGECITKPGRGNDPLNEVQRLLLIQTRAQSRMST